jgi:ankyrin repeat protein
VHCCVAGENSSAVPPVSALTAEITLTIPSKVGSLVNTSPQISENNVGELWEEVESDEESDSNTEENEEYYHRKTVVETSTLVPSPINTPMPPRSDSASSILEQLFQACSMPNDSGISLLKSYLEERSKRCEIEIDSFRDKRKNNCTLLHLAARFNDVECMSYLVHNHMAHVESKDWSQSTPLHYAVANNSREAVVFLLSCRVNANAKDSFHAFPLEIAMKNNNLEIMRDLLLWKADIHLKGNRGDTVLHQACRRGYLKRVKFLIEECNASPLRLNDDNENVLFTALSYPSIVQYLCGKAGSFQQLCKMVSSTNVFGKTIFHVSAERGSLEGLLVIVQSLKNLCDDREELIQFLVNRLNEYEPNKGYNALLLAVYFGHSRMVKYLALSNEVNVNLRANRRYCSPFSYSTKCSRNL